jgi:hypothetical protein
MRAAEQSGTGAAPRGAPHEGTPEIAKGTQRLTDAERDQRRAQDRERLQRACDQLLSSEGWRRWVRARARNGLARYSVSNLCLILLANPQASFVAGFKAWIELGYCVRKGEHAIWIFAPMPIRTRVDAESSEDAQTGQPRVLFRAVPVFDTLSRAAHSSPGDSSPAAAGSRRHPRGIQRLVFVAGFR